MSDYTATEVEAAFEAMGNDWYSIAYENEGHETALLINGEAVKAVKVAAKPPAEGEGENVWIVFSIGNQFFEKSGYYASHYGTDWDGDVREVRPREMTVTAWDSV